jgi:OmpA-OmpF porin, OOP family
MAALRTSLCLCFALAAGAVPPASAQNESQPAGKPGFGNVSSYWLPGTERSYLGLNLSRANRQLPCAGISLLCDDTDRSMSLHAGKMVGNFWGVELGYLDTRRATLGSSLPGAQGLNLSLVGKAPLSRTFGVYGKFGTTLGRSDTSMLGGSGVTAPGYDRGFGLSYGAGVSLAFTPKLSATLEFESNDFRFAGSPGSPVRSTNLGLQYRY